MGNDLETVFFARTDPSLSVVLEDEMGHVSVKRPYVEIDDTLKPGTYKFILKNPVQGNTLIEITIRVAAGSSLNREGYLIDETECFEQKAGRRAPLAITSLGTEGDSETQKKKKTSKSKEGGDKNLGHITLENWSMDTRVHVIPSYFLPAFEADKSLRCVSLSDPSSVTFSVVKSQFVTGRELGDEYRYAQCLLLQKPF